MYRNYNPKKIIIPEPIDASVIDYCAAMHKIAPPVSLRIVLKSEPIKFNTYQSEFTLDTHIECEAVVMGEVINATRKLSHVQLIGPSHREQVVQVKDQVANIVIDQIYEKVKGKEKDFMASTGYNYYDTSTCTSTSSATFSIDEMNNAMFYMTTAAASPTMTIGTSSDSNLWYDTTTSATIDFNTLPVTDYLVHYPDNPLTGNYHIEFVNPYVSPVETEEDRFDREWNAIISNKQWNNKELQREAAKERSLELLMRNLTKSQLKRFEKDQCIPIDGPSGKRYLIKPAKSINIEVIGEHHKICAGPEPSHSVPLYDSMLAQKLMLEHDERRFLEIAIVHR